MGKKVLVTGADGFIGSHLCEELVKQGNDVRAFTFYNAFTPGGWICSFNKELRNSIDLFEGDIRDAGGVFKAMQGIEEVYHLASLISIPFSYHSPHAFIETNVNGTLNVMQAAKRGNISKMIFTSTSMVYGIARYIPVDEVHKTSAYSPFVASKIGAEALAESFYESYKFPVSIVRLFNTYGPRQKKDALIPSIINQMMEGKDEIVLGGLTHSRDFSYVKDVVAALIAIAKTEKSNGEVINVSTESEISIEDLARIITGKFGRDVPFIVNDRRKRSKKMDVYKLLGSNAKLKKMTGWEPKYTLEEGITETIEWIENRINNPIIENRWQ
ncbi:dTDP-glucose 4,6-dehydratase [Acetitomaculum ruminis DSM 5522]|uniref:dTDP-glucose 4,6-dehydratase n=1 Tax=Acetitomaculum ruminis DSM 5522 TaxID=1120918 RepID=A0A1I1A8X7_9FIRM|nr:SDR family NAD(P)-dependent oxidoreductase [Acetitomaculum ruminis]SFB34404.1 dTDP-glucose 4,6-dehydratase [Acetitomaculum ruminis DSM 5522]